MTAPALAYLAELGVDLDPHQPVRELSLAQHQLVEMAKALHTESRVLLLDEPTASLSPQEAEHLFEVIRRLAGRGACVVFVSHKLEEGVFLEQPVVRNITVTVWQRLAKAFGFVSAREERDTAQDLVDRPGIRVSGLQQNAGELSGGNQQKASLATGSPRKPGCWSTTNRPWASTSVPSGPSTN